MDANWIDFYTERDLILACGDRVRSDAVYNDISICNAAPLLCENILHRHPRALGRGMVDAYRELVKKSKDACRKKEPSRFIPFGTELIVENFVDLVDFYHARGYADLQGFFEWNGDPRGNIEKIPLFTFVYHEMGPMRLDGFLKLSKEFGDIFYYIVSRTILWGAIPELNFEFSSPELFDGMSGSTYYVTYDRWTNWIEDKSPYRADKEKVAFLKEAIRTRLDFGKKYLVYGRMEKPPTIVNDIPQIELDYFHYNVFIEGGDRLKKGTIKVPSILTSAYVYRGESLGVFYVNLDKSQPLKIKTIIDPEEYGLKTDNYKTVLMTNHKSITLENYDPQKEIELILPPRQVGMLEIKGR